jgi:hypothetical protein
MGFDVQADDLDRYAAQVGRAAEDVLRAKRYAQLNGKVAVSNEGLFGLIVGAHGRVFGRVDSALAKADSVLRAAQKELTRSANYYRESDLANAVSVDAAYPATQR